MKKILLAKEKYALVDDSDYGYLNQYRWHIHEKRYLRSSSGILMHRLIINTPEGMDTDHIDGNGLNNQRNNLRICKKFQNQANRGISKNNLSGYKGVYWHKDSKKWRAKLMFDYKNIYLGLFKNKINAALAYNQAAKKYFGEFAKLNKVATKQIQNMV